jgi:hypothetical protein
VTNARFHCDSTNLLWRTLFRSGEPFTHNFQIVVAIAKFNYKLGEGTQMFHLESRRDVNSLANQSPVRSRSPLFELNHRPTPVFRHSQNTPHLCLELLELVLNSSNGSPIRASCRLGVFGEPSLWTTSTNVLLTQTRGFQAAYF